MDNTEQQVDEPLRYDIGGMHCAACSSRVERTLGKLPGIARVSVNLATGKAQVWPVSTQAPDLDKSIREQVEKLGFTARPSVRQQAGEQFAKDRAAAEEEKKERLHRLIPMAIFSIPLLFVAMGHMLGMPLPGWLEPHQEPKNYILVQFFLTLPVIWLGRHFYIEGLGALWRRAPNMDTLVAVGTGAAFLFSLVNSILGLAGNEPQARSMNLYYESCAVLLTMIELGKYLEFSAKRKASDAIGALMRLTPEKALLLENDNATPKEVPLDAVRANDRLLVRPGSRVPVDGLVLEGNSAIDMSLMTGESIPVPVGPDDKLVAGSLNGEGSLIMRATAVGEDTRLARIINLVRDAQGSKAPIARLADRVSYYFVPAVMAFAIIAALAWLIFSKQPITLALTVFVAILVMACPCAMGLATPMSIMVGTGRGAQLGVLIKNGAALEQAGQITALCLDKTGTLTTGTPAMTEISLLGHTPTSKKDILAFAASLEGRSEHPLALAIVKAAAAENRPGYPVEDVSVRPGLGISGLLEADGKKLRVLIGNVAFMAENGLCPDATEQSLLDSHAEAGQTPLLIALGQEDQKTELAAIIALADELRPESREVARKLQDMGIELHMLTGDNERTARAVAKNAGIENVHAGLLPAQKADFIKKLQEEGKIVGMVGDGLNDAPALALANVGLAVGSGVDVSAEAGDIVLMHGGMKAVLTALALSRATMHNIRQNLGWAFGYNIIGLPVAAGCLYLFGGPLLSPMLAGTAMALSSVSVVTNALRLRWFER